MYSAEERNAYRFGMAWGWEFSFWVNYPLKKQFFFAVNISFGPVLVLCDRLTNEYAKCALTFTVVQQLLLWLHLKEFLMTFCMINNIDNVLGHHLMSNLASQAKPLENHWSKRFHTSIPMCLPYFHCLQNVFGPHISHGLCASLLLSPQIMFCVI